MSLVPLATEDALDSLVATGDLVVAYVSTAACNVCKVLRPRVDEIVGRLGVAGAYVDATTLPQTAGQRLVFAVPTVLVYGDRRELARFGRHLSLEELEETLARFQALMAES